jgi:hypothetical protein
MLDSFYCFYVLIRLACILTQCCSKLLKSYSNVCGVLLEKSHIIMIYIDTVRPPLSFLVFIFFWQPDLNEESGADPDLALALALSISSAAASAQQRAPSPPPLTAPPSAVQEPFSSSSSRPTMWLPQPSAALPPIKQVHDNL